MKTKKKKSSFWGDKSKNLHDMNIMSLGFHDIKKVPSPAIRPEGDYSDHESSRRLRDQQIGFRTDIRGSLRRHVMVDGEVRQMDPGMGQRDFELQRRIGNPHPWTTDTCEDTDCDLCHGSECDCSICESEGVNAYAPEHMD